MVLQLDYPTAQTAYVWFSPLASLLARHPFLQTTYNTPVASSLSHPASVSLGIAL